MKNNQKILKKLGFSLQIQAGPESELGGLEPFTFICIYGIGLDGLSRFEIDISELGIEESITVELNRGESALYFAHYYRSVCEAIKKSPSEPLRMQMTLREISEPEPSEVVSAIAGLQKNHGCSGDCGCGCGD